MKLRIFVTEFRNIGICYIIGYVVYIAIFCAVLGALIPSNFNIDKFVIDSIGLFLFIGTCGGLITITFYHYNKLKNERT